MSLLIAQEMALVCRAWDILPQCGRIAIPHAQLAPTGSGGGPAVTDDDSCLSSTRRLEPLGSFCRTASICYNPKVSTAVVQPTPNVADLACAIVVEIPHFRRLIEYDQGRNTIYDQTVVRLTVRLSGQGHLNVARRGWVTQSNSHRQVGLVFANRSGPLLNCSHWLKLARMARSLCRVDRITCAASAFGACAIGPLGRRRSRR
jgi:hypothetical protein